MSEECEKDEVDKVGLPSSFTFDELQEAAVAPFHQVGKSNKCSSLTRFVEPHYTERIQYLEDLLTVRILVLTLEPEQGLFIELHDSDGYSTEGHGYLHKDFVWRRNIAQYNLALIKQKNNPTRKQVFKLEFEASPTLYQEHAIVELFPNTPMSVPFKLNCIESYLNEETCIMSCANVPFEYFENYAKMFNELASLRKEWLREDIVTARR